jgi:hypothetical protein
MQQNDFRKKSNMNEPRLKMKTIKITITLLMLGQLSLRAQTVTEDYLPKAGNFALGVDATPFFNYIGNMFNGTNTAPGNSNTLDLSSSAIYGKYYIMDKMAVRAILAISGIHHKDEAYVRDDAAFYLDPLSNKELIDTRTNTNNAYFASFAIQKFIGERRLRGFMGMQILFGYQSITDKNSYANPMSDLNPMPSIAPTLSGYTTANERPLEVRSMNSSRIGTGLIAGIEYFIFPQLCMGGEISLNAIYSRNGQLYTKSETFANNSVLASDKTYSPGGNELTIKTFRFTPNGYMEQLGFYVMFHF